eukprot:1143495-Pelagomonas_calceolata.AAC.2
MRTHLAMQTSRIGGNKHTRHHRPEALAVNRLAAHKCKGRWASMQQRSCCVKHLEESDVPVHAPK